MRVDGKNINPFPISMHYRKMMHNHRAVVTNEGFENEDKNDGGKGLREQCPGGTPTDYMRAPSTGKQSGTT